MNSAAQRSDSRRAGAPAASSEVMGVQACTPDAQGTMHSTTCSASCHSLACPAPPPPPAPPTCSVMAISGATPPSGRSTWVPWPAVAFCRSERGREEQARVGGWLGTSGRRCGVAFAFRAFARHARRMGRHKQCTRQQRRAPRRNQPQPFVLTPTCSEASPSSAPVPARAAPAPHPPPKTEACAGTAAPGPAAAGPTVAAPVEPRG